MVDDNRAFGGEGSPITEHRDIGQQVRDDKSSLEKPMHDNETFV
jgi:hypothetical protein